MTSKRPTNPTNELASEVSAEPTEEHEALDQDERELRALRLDLPGGGSTGAGIVSISVGKIPRREFFRTHPTIRLLMPMLDHTAGMETEFYLVAKSMVEQLAAIDIETHAYALYLITTQEGAVRWVPVRQEGNDGSQNEWNRTKEIALVKGISGWVRLVSDKANGRYRVYPAPDGRFPDPAWPDLSEAKLLRLAFRDRGNLIDSVEHPLFRKWAALDHDE